MNLGVTGFFSIGIISVGLILDLQVSFAGRCFVLQAIHAMNKNRPSTLNSPSEDHTPSPGAITEPSGHSPTLEGKMNGGPAPTLSPPDTHRDLPVRPRPQTPSPDKRVPERRTISTMTAEEFGQISSRPKEPILIKGYAKNWPACQLWTMDYLKRTVGHIQVPVEAHSMPLFMPYVEVNTFPEETMTIGEFIDKLAQQPNGGKWYYGSALSLDGDLSALLPDVCPTDLYGRRPMYMRFYFGPSTSGTQLHYDPDDTFVVVVSGAKVIPLFSPTEYSNLYPFRAWSRWGHFSQVDIDNPDFEKFPRYSPEARIDCIVEEGDGMFMPHGWWHRPVSEGLTIALTFQYDIPFLDLFRTANLRFRVVDIYREFIKNGGFGLGTLKAAFRR